MGKEGESSSEISVTMTLRLVAGDKGRAGQRCVAQGAHFKAP